MEQPLPDTHLARLAHSLERERHKEHARSPKWNEVRDTFLKTHNACAACGHMDHMQVHHCKPYHLHPELELEPSNFITLCMGPNECHLLIGHGGSFFAFDPHVRHHALAYAAADAAGRKVIVEDARRLRRSM